MGGVICICVCIHTKFLTNLRLGNVLANVKNLWWEDNEKFWEQSACSLQSLILKYFLFLFVFFFFFPLSFYCSNSFFLFFSFYGRYAINVDQKYPSLFFNPNCLLNGRWMRKRPGHSDNKKKKKKTKRKKMIKKWIMVSFI